MTKHIHARKFMVNLLFEFYDLLFIFLLAVYLPVYFLRRRISWYSLKCKLGFIPFMRRHDSIWIQAVSVGEVMLAAQLIDRLKSTRDERIVLSTTTLAGYSAAKSRYSDKVTVLYFPYDISFVLRRFIKIINPKMLICLETELWPNLFRILEDNGVPIVIVNGRISDKAFKRYQSVKWLTSFILGRCSFIGAQNEEYLRRFMAMGCARSRIAVTGNIKFENIVCDETKLKQIRDTYIPLLKGNYKIILLAASTHYPEEQIVLDIYSDIARNYHNVTLLIAPRHIERISTIEKSVRDYGFVPQRITSAVSFMSSSEKVYILDTIGELIYFYAISDVCFVGGSIANTGGHNILEPIFFKKPVCFGPHMQNFRDVEAAVLSAGAALQAKDAGELKHILIQLISSPTVRAGLAEKCSGIFFNGKSFLEQNMEVITRFLK